MRLLVVFIATGFFWRTPACAVEHVYSNDLTQKNVQQARDAYGENRKRLEEYRMKAALRYRNTTSEEKKAVVNEARRTLEKQLREKIFPAWDGTIWDFNGTSSVPGEGKIACGYFVSTCLTQMGFKVSRVRLAQQPSQRIIETFMPKSERKILAGGASMARVREYLKSRGDGIYIVGLDTHVGFISVEGDDMAFIHSSYYRPDSVVKTERLKTKNPLSDSKYRVFGKIFADEMVIKWLRGDQYSVKR